MKNSNSILFLAFIYAGVINLVKLIITQIYFEQSVNGGLFLEFINDFTLGFILSVILFSIKKNTFAIIFLLGVLFPFILLEFLCLHYKFVFGRLPSVDILFYISELTYLKSSLKANLPALLIMLEVLIVFSVASISYFYLKQNKEKLIKIKTIETTSFLFICLSIIFQLFPTVLPERYLWSSREAFVWLIQSNFIKETYKFDELQLDKNDFDRFLATHGHIKPGPIIDYKYPVCRLKHDTSNKSGDKNVILLILEGVGIDEMYAKYNDVYVMPNLVAIANDNLYFNKAYAPGSKSVQAISAVFSGLPSHTYYNYLWAKPLLNFIGFPNILSAKGYKTAYFHGSDLSFEQQRQYLKSIGFEEINEYDPNKPYPVYGWGYDDGVMLDEVKEWIENNKINDDAPYLVSLFTLGTHDPYLLPSEWEPVFLKKETSLKTHLNWPVFDDVGNINLAALESYHFLDYHLGEFYKWYSENEKQNGTILIIVGDHGSHLINESENRKSHEYYFQVPMIFSGFDIKDRHESKANRIAGLHDLPATIMGLLGNETHDCNLGLDLLMSEKEWPVNRLVYAVGGDSLESLFLYTNQYELIFDRLNEKFISMVNAETIKQKSDSFLNELKAKIDNLFKVHFYLLKNNKYFPEPVLLDNSKELPDVEEPIYVSHRGNIDGPGDKHYENSRVALDKVVNSGMHWVEVDVQLTFDGIPVLMHDPHINLPDKGKINIEELTLKQLKGISGFSDILTLEEALATYSDKLNMLIEVKEISHISRILYGGRVISRLIKERPGNKQVIVDSFQEDLISSIKNQCDCEAGLDTPFKKQLDEEALNYVKNMGMDWVYVHHSVINSEFVKKAHEAGLKVMAYTVNSSSIIEEWNKGQLPDGVITDNAKLAN